MSPDRFLTLGSTSNFRHMGGYRTVEGRVTHADRLYRSGYVSAPGAEVADMFARLGITTVCDFRSPVERERHPLTVGDRVGAVELGMLVASVENLGRLLFTDDLTPAGAEKIMADRYRELAHEELPGYRAMFQHLLDGGGDAADGGDGADGGGVLVMCSFGKDRAGIASALLLYALGVPAAQVEADYLLSATAYADEDAAARKFEQFFTAKGVTVDREVLATILDARPPYLRAALEVIDARAGGDMDRFLDRDLGLDAAARSRLVARFTAPG